MRLLTTVSDLGRILENRKSVRGVGKGECASILQKKEEDRIYKPSSGELDFHLELITMILFFSLSLNSI